MMDEGKGIRGIFGDIDIYLFDQILKGRFASGARILDAGCGSGRNLVWFLQNGFDVAAVDNNSHAVEQVRGLVRTLAPEWPEERIRENIRVAPVDDLPFPDASFDAVICSAVLHFARDEEHFNRMVDEMWRVLKPGGLFFARLASTIGIESRVERIEGRWHHLPDGSQRFLVDEKLLQDTMRGIGGEPADPIKTTIVQNLRSMTTWVLVKTRH